MTINCDSNYFCNRTFFEAQLGESSSSCQNNRETFIIDILPCLWQESFKTSKLKNMKDTTLTWYHLEKPVKATCAWETEWLQLGSDNVGYVISCFLFFIICLLFFSVSPYLTRRLVATVLDSQKFFFRNTHRVDRHKGLGLGKLLFAPEPCQSNTIRNFRDNTLLFQKSINKEL